MTPELEALEKLLSYFDKRANEHRVYATRLKQSAELQDELSEHASCYRELVRVEIAKIKEGEA